jgi:hypothetical protein
MTGVRVIIDKGMVSLIYHFRSLSAFADLIQKPMGLLTLWILLESYQKMGLLESYQKMG